MPPCNIYSDDKPDVAGLSCLRFCFFGFGLLNFEFKWVLCWEIFIWNSVLFELRLCFYWHFHWYWVHNHEMTFRAQGKIHFHFHSFYVWIYHFDNFSHILPNSPSSVLAGSYFNAFQHSFAFFCFQINLIISISLSDLGSDIMLDFLIRTEKAQHNFSDRKWVFVYRVCGKSSPLRTCHFDNCFLCLRWSSSLPPLLVFLIKNCTRPESRRTHLLND